jgi:hypothetical protein
MKLEKWNEEGKQEYAQGIGRRTPRRRPASSLPLNWKPRTHSNIRFYPCEVVLQRPVYRNRSRRCGLCDVAEPMLP